MGYTASYSKPYENGYVNLPSKDTPEMAEHINARDNALVKIEDYLANKMPVEYALVTAAGYSLTLNIDENYLMTVSLLDKNGNTLSTKTVDFPIESMVVNASYADGTLTLTLQNGNVLKVDISAIVSGLVNDTRTIAGIDLKDDITAEELRNALSVPTKTSQLENDSKYITADDVIPEDSVVAKGEIKPWLYDTSGEETIIGVYNGKPLYRKSFSADISCPASGIEELKISDYISNVEKVVNYFGYNNSLGLYIPSILVGQNETFARSFSVSESEDSIYYTNGSYTTTTNENITFTLEYTKTTDAEGSGSKLMPYGYANRSISGLLELESEVAGVVEQLSDKVLTQYKAFHLTSQGWYRIAEIVGTSTLLLGHLGSGCDIDIRKLYASSSSENHTIKFRTSSTLTKFLDEASVGERFDITKIRYTYDLTNLKAYIEIYYNFNNINTIGIHLSNQRAVNHVSDIHWNLIDVVATEETVEGIAVLTTHEFSQNKSYESEIDAINSRLTYKDISSSIDVGDSGFTASGYAENGIVAIRIVIPAGTTGLKAVSINNAYAPRININGDLGEIRSMADYPKIVGYIGTSGVINVYCDTALASEESITFVYPLKS